MVGAIGLGGWLAGWGNGACNRDCAQTYSASKSACFKSWSRIVLVVGMFLMVPSTKSCSLVPSTWECSHV